MRASYGKSIQYSIQSLVSFVQNAHDDNLVLVLLGDHQPAPKVSGAGRDARRADLDRHPRPRRSSTASRPGAGSPACGPAADAPVWPMDAFRNRFLDTFATRPTTLAGK